MNLKLLLLIPLLASCTHLGLKEEYSSNSKSITVMAYNVENLFDTENDPDKNDDTFLPVSEKKSEFHNAICRNQPERYRDDCLHLDWNPKTLDRKMQRLADVILQVKNGKGPDVLLVEEVENQQVVEMLNNRYLKAAGYKYVVVPEGPDNRGIDVGLLTRLEPVGEAKLHPVKFVKGEKVPDYYLKSKTRSILQVDLKLPNGDLLTVFGVHFPSAAAPTVMREQAIDNLNAVVATLPKDRNIIVGGDFNINILEDVKYGVYSKKLAKDWAVSHYYNKNIKARGTHYYNYDKTWSFLDALLFSANLQDEGRGNWKVERKSIRVPNYSYYQKNRWDSPARYSYGKYSVGVSDHWPIAADLVLRNKQESKNVIDSKSTKQ